MGSWNRKERKLVRYLARRYVTGEEYIDSADFRTGFGFTDTECYALLSRMDSERLVQMGGRARMQEFRMLPAIVDEARALDAARGGFWLTFGSGVAGGIVVTVLGGVLLQMVQRAPRNTTQDPEPPVTSKPAGDIENVGQP